VVGDGEAAVGEGEQGRVEGAVDDEEQDGDEHDDTRDFRDRCGDVAQSDGGEWPRGSAESSARGQQ
jgi:hypothetical protein